MVYTVVHYNCYQCGEVDSDKIGPDDTPAVIINCWNCKAGYEYNASQLSQQKAAKRGMYLMTPEQWAAYQQQTKGAVAAAAN